MQLVTPDFGLIVWQLIIFGVLFFALGKFAWKPIVKILNERESSIEDAIKMAENTRKEMELLKAGNEKLLIEARTERDKTLKEAKEAAAKIVSDAKADAQKAAGEEIEKARVSFEQEKNAAISQIRKEAASLSLELAEKVLKSELKDKSAQEKLVNDLMESISIK